MHYKFHKVYIEITNICGLSCSFCPSKNILSKTMSLEFFEKVVKDVSLYTKDIALHMFGDPLTLSNLSDYLDIAYRYNLKVHITTTGYHLKNFLPEVFLHKAIKQINFSLNSFNKNNMNLTLKEYMGYMFKLCDLKLATKKEFFINFRLWNLDNNNSEKEFNQNVYKLLEQHFKVKLHNTPKQKDSIRLASKILLHFDSYFRWPTLEDSQITHNYCHGLTSQIGILANGTVVPCCLDSFGVIDLGNLHKNSLKDILYSQKALNIVKNFQNNIAIEPLCQKCRYKDRFHTKSH